MRKNQINISWNGCGANHRRKTVRVCQSDDFNNHKDCQNSDNGKDSRGFHVKFDHAPARVFNPFICKIPLECTIRLTLAAIPLRFVCSNACSTICPPLDLDFRLCHACGLDALGFWTIKPRWLFDCVCRFFHFRFSPPEEFGIQW